MKAIKTAVSAVILLAVIATSSGCGAAAGRRTPEQWLSLSYSGLAAMDKYAFNGSMSIQVEGGSEVKPQSFEGKVVDHHQLTIQSNVKDSLYMNPVQVLEALNESHEQVVIVGETKKLFASNPTITLRITEKSADTKKRWKQIFEQQLEELNAALPAAHNAAYRAEWNAEMTRSREELTRILSTLQAGAQYDLVIDKKRLLPLKIDGITTFNYEKNGRPVAETRHTTVRLQDFDGAASEAVQ